jgi:thiol-disulfide isomerase/thioredoxin
VNGELQLPAVPQGMTDARERASYIVAHFWDALSFEDTTLTHDTVFMEQNFANYASLFPIADMAEVRSAVADLISRAEADTTAFHLMGYIANKYLYEPNSPMLNEEFYELFLPPLIDSKLTGEAERSTLLFRSRCINMNRRGTRAANFSYTDTAGRMHSLHYTDTAGAPMLLIFFDPECEHCQESLQQLSESATAQQLVADGRLTILAVYAVGDKSTWRQSQLNLPSQWIVGFDETGIEDRDLYVLRATPTCFLLDADKTVLMKDVPAEVAVAAVAGQKK